MMVCCLSTSGITHISDSLLPVVIRTERVLVYYRVKRYFESDRFLVSGDFTIPARTSPVGHFAFFGS